MGQARPHTGTACSHLPASDRLRRLRLGCFCWESHANNGSQTEGAKRCVWKASSGGRFWKSPKTPESTALYITRKGDWMTFRSASASMETRAQCPVSSALVKGLAPTADCNAGPSGHLRSEQSVFLRGGSEGLLKQTVYLLQMCLSWLLLLSREIENN